MEVVNVIEPSEKYYELRLTETEMNVIMIGLGVLSQSALVEAKRSTSYATSKISGVAYAQILPLWNSFRNLLGHLGRE